MTVLFNSLMSRRDPQESIVGHFGWLIESPESNFNRFRGGAKMQFVGKTVIDWS